MIASFSLHSVGVAFGFLSNDALSNSIKRADGTFVAALDTVTVYVNGTFNVRPHCQPVHFTSKSYL